MPGGLSSYARESVPLLGRQARRRAPGETIERQRILQPRAKVVRAYQQVTPTHRRPPNRTRFPASRRNGAAALPGHIWGSVRALFFRLWLVPFSNRPYPIGSMVIITLGRYA